MGLNGPKIWTVYFIFTGMLLFLVSYNFSVPWLFFLFRMNLALFVQNILMNEDQIERGRKMSEQIVALQRNYYGDIISFKTSSGRVISYRKALQEVEDGTIDGIHLIENQDGSNDLLPETTNSFNEFPTF